MSLRAAVNAMCRACIYDAVAGRGTWRAQVDACTAYSCPLFQVRPRARGGAEVRPQVQDEANLAPKRTIIETPDAKNELRATDVAQ